MNMKPAKRRFGSNMSHVALMAAHDGLTPFELATGFAGSCAAVLTSAGAANCDIAKTFRVLADNFQDDCVIRSPGS